MLRTYGDFTAPFSEDRKPEWLPLCHAQAEDLGRGMTQLRDALSHQNAQSEAAEIMVNLDSWQNPVYPLC